MNFDEELPPPPVSPPRVARERDEVPPSDRPPAYQAPSPEAAEEFRQTNLPRRIKDPLQKTGHRLARPGEKIKTKDGRAIDPPLYDVWGTSYKAMDELGIGLSLYFRQLLFLGIVIGLCACVYITTIVHNSLFNDNGDEAPAILTGTAHNASREDLSLQYNGIPDLIVTLMLVMFALVFRDMEKSTVESIDLAQQTAQDYSVCIHSPPRAAGDTGIDMYDPDTYHKKFAVYGEIVFITICLENGNLMKMVAVKRVLEHKIDVLKAQEREEDGSGATAKTTADLKGWQAWLQKKLGLFPTKDYLDARLQETKSCIEGMTRAQFDPKRVYITFNTEHAQRKCLKAVETGLWEERLARLKRKEVNQNAVIGGKVCRIDEAEEPSDILWENIDTTWFQRARTWALSAFLSGLFLAGAFFILQEIFESGLLAAIFIALINAVLPLVIRGLTLGIEVHKSVTQSQGSMMFKLVVARAINSAGLLFIITSDTDQFEADTLSKILTILAADAFFGPLLRLLNVPDLIGRKLIGPKQKTQAEMNVFFQGALWNLAERYTDMIKTIVVGLFYSAIVPTGLIVTAGGMMMLYWVDKYSLLRLWKRPPAYNESLSVQTRMYITLCILVHLVMARVFFAKWPGQSEDEMPECHLFSCNYADDETNYYSDDQRKIVAIYEILAVLVFAAGGSLFVLTYARHYGTKIVVNKHSSVGKASDIPYRSVSGISAYTPLIYVRELTDPLLAIDVKDLPSNAHSFLPLRIGGFYNPEELSMNSERDFPPPVFSKVERNRQFGKVRYYLGPMERLQQAPKNGNILFLTGGPNRPETAGEEGNTVAVGRFGLTRQASAFGNVSFMLPAYPIEELSAPQLSGRTQQRTFGARGPLPAGWEERVTAYGRPYYVCHHTGTTQWERPRMAVPTSWRSSRFTPLEQDTDCGGVAVQDVHNAVKDLPSGWEVKFAQDGRPYYVDNNRQTTQWQHPVPLEREHFLPAGDEFPSEGGTRFLEQQTAAGLKFYVNTNTLEARWSPPRRRRGSRGITDTSASSSARMENGLLATSLPPGWERRTTPAGRVYYANHNLRITQWNPPDPLGGAQEEKSASRAPAH